MLAPLPSASVCMGPYSDKSISIYICRGINLRVICDSDLFVHYREMRSEKYLPLFETKRARGLVLFRSFAVTLFVGICLILFYRVSNIPRDGEEGRWVWIGLLGAELWFGFYWVLTQALRWNQVYRLTFKDRLSLR